MSPSRSLPVSVMETAVSSEVVALPAFATGVSLTAVMVRLTVTVDEVS